MTKRLSRNLSKNRQKTFAAWDAAISDAERMIREAKDTIESLRFSIHFFKEQRDAGAPFPGESAEQSEAAGQ